jgi:hypothetical protein
VPGGDNIMAIRPIASRLVLWGFAVAVVLLWVSPAHAETTVTLVNRQEGTVKIAVYHAGDALQAVPLMAWNVNPGKSVDWDGAPATFNVKIFQPQLVDQLLASRNNVPHNTVVTVSADNSIAFQAKKIFRIQNVSSEKSIKVLMYSAGDSAMVVPLTAFTLTSKKIIYWPEAPKRFNVKVFRPQFLDQLLVIKKNVADRTFFIFRGSGNSFTVEIR